MRDPVKTIALRMIKQADTMIEAIVGSGNSVTMFSRDYYGIVHFDSPKEAKLWNTAYKNLVKLKRSLIEHYVYPKSYVKHTRKK